jgi:hypothetical protein
MTQGGRFELAPLVQRLGFGRSGGEAPTAALDRRS